MVNAPTDAGEVSQVTEILQCRRKILLPQLDHPLITHLTCQRKIKRRRAAQGIGNAGNGGLSRRGDVGDSLECPFIKVSLSVGCQLNRRFRGEVHRGGFTLACRAHRPQRSRIAGAIGQATEHDR